MSNSNKRNLEDFIKDFEFVDTETSFTFFDNKKDIVYTDSIDFSSSNEQTFEITHEESKPSKILIGYENKLTEGVATTHPVYVNTADGPDISYKIDHIENKLENHENRITVLESIEPGNPSSEDIADIIKRLQDIDGKGIKETDWGNLKDGYTDREDPQSYIKEDADIPYIHDRINSFFNFVDYENNRRIISGGKIIKNELSINDVGYFTSLRIDPNQLIFSRIKNIFTFDIVVNNQHEKHLVDNQWVKMIIHQRKPGKKLCEYIGASVNCIKINSTDEEEYFCEDCYKNDRLTGAQVTSTYSAYKAVKKRFIFENLVIDPEKVTYFSIIPSDKDDKGNKVTYSLDEEFNDISPDTLEDNIFAKDILLPSEKTPIFSNIITSTSHTKLKKLQSLASTRLPVTRIQDLNGNNLLDYETSSEDNQTMFHGINPYWDNLHSNNNENKNYLPWINISSCRLSSSKEGFDSYTSSNTNNTEGTHAFIDLTQYGEKARDFFTESKSFYEDNDRYYYLLPNTINYFGKISGGSVAEIDGTLDLRKVKWNNNEVIKRNKLIEKDVKSTLDVYSTAEIHFYADKYSTVTWPLDNFELINSEVPNFSLLGDREIYITAQLYYIPNSNSSNNKLRILYQTEINDIEEERNEYNRHLFYTSIPELIENSGVHNTIFNNTNTISFLLKPNVTYELGTLNTPCYTNSYDANNVPKIYNTVDFSGLHFNDEENAKIDNNTFYLHGIDKDPSSPIYNIPPVSNEEISKCELSFTLLKGVNIIWPSNWIWDETPENIPGNTLDDNNEPIENNLYNSHITIELEYTPKVMRGTYEISPAQYRAKVKHFESVEKGFISSVPLHNFYTNIENQNAEAYNYGFVLKKPALEYINIDELLEVNIQFTYASGITSPETLRQLAVYKETASEYQFIGASTNTIDNRINGVQTFKFNSLNLKAIKNTMSSTDKLIFIFRAKSNNEESLPKTLPLDDTANIKSALKSRFVCKNADDNTLADYEFSIVGSTVGTTRYFPRCSFIGYKIP